MKLLNKVYYSKRGPRKNIIVKPIHFSFRLDLKNIILVTGDEYVSVKFTLRCAKFTLDII